MFKLNLQRLQTFASAALYNGVQQSQQMCYYPVLGAMGERK